MRNFSIVFIVGVVIAGGLFLAHRASDTAVPTKTTDQAAGDNTQFESFVSPETGVSFLYKTAPDGYVLDDVTEFSSTEEGSVLAAYRVMNAQEKTELENNDEGREGPPVITVMIHTNAENRSASQWIDDVPRFSNIGLVMGEVNRDAVVGGANAVRYTTDGLYVTDNAVVASGGYIYHFAGPYLEVNSVIHQDFLQLLDSVVFLPSKI